jgi:hypothetical protein
MRAVLKKGGTAATQAAALSRVQKIRRLAASVERERKRLDNSLS